MEWSELKHSFGAIWNNTKSSTSIVMRY